MKETFVDLEQAYKDKVDKIYEPNKYYTKKLEEERKQNGYCIQCGRKKITKSQKKHGLVSCHKCRTKRKDKMQIRRKNK